MACCVDGKASRRNSCGRLRDRRQRKTQSLVHRREEPRKAHAGQPPPDRTALDAEIPRYRDCVDATDSVIPDSKCIPSSTEAHFIRVHISSTFTPVTPLLGVFGDHTFESWARIQLP